MNYFRASRFAFGGFAVSVLLTGCGTDQQARESLPDDSSDKVPASSGMGGVTPDDIETDPPPAIEPECDSVEVHLIERPRKEGLPDVVLLDEVWGTVSLQSEYEEKEEIDEWGDIEIYSSTFFFVVWNMVDGTTAASSPYCTDSFTGTDDYWCGFEGAAFSPSGKLYLGHTNNGGGAASESTYQMLRWKDDASRDDSWEEVGREMSVSLGGYFEGPYFVENELVIIASSNSVKPWGMHTPHMLIDDEWTPLPFSTGGYVDAGGGSIYRSNEGRFFLSVPKENSESSFYEIMENELVPVLLCDAP